MNHNLTELEVEHLRSLIGEHANLAVTTQYLDLEIDEVAESLKDYL